MTSNIVKRSEVLDATSAKPVSDLQWSNDAVVAATGNKVYVIDKSELDNPNRLPPRVIGDGTQVNSLCFSRDGKTLLTVGEVVKLWDTRTGRSAKKFHQPSRCFN